MRNKDLHTDPVLLAIRRAYQWSKTPVHAWQVPAWADEVQHLSLSHTYRHIARLKAAGLVRLHSTRGGYVPVQRGGGHG